MNWWQISAVLYALVSSAAASYTMQYAPGITLLSLLINAVIVAYTWNKLK